MVKKMKKGEKIMLGLFFVAIIVMTGIVIYTSNMKSTLENATTYCCDYRSMNFLKTSIEIKKDDQKYATVKGKNIKFFEDPLEIKKDSVTVGEADDKFHLISQDSHSITVGDEVIEVVGKIELFGEEYSLYNSKGESIGTVKVNIWGTNGKFSDNNGNVIAEYNSGWLRKDYSVTISKDSNISDDTILLIFASYTSDYDFDHK